MDLIKFRLRSLVLLLSLAAVTLPAGSCLAAALAPAINALLRSPKVAGTQVGISIVELVNHRPVQLYQFNPNVPLMPGSNGKILTTAAAFDRLGAKATIKTRLYRIGSDLMIVGGGDPALGDPVLCQRVGWKVTTAFDNWAAHLKELGLTHFHNIYVDDSIFNHHFVNPLWPRGGSQRLDWYEAQVGGLNCSLNCLNWSPYLLANGRPAVSYVPQSRYTSVSIQASPGPYNRVWMWRAPGSPQFILRGQVARVWAGPPLQVTVPDPGMFTGWVLHHSLAAAGITLTGSVKRLTLADAEAQGFKPVLLATYETPLADILKRANTDSINLMAECLCKLLGHDATGQPGSWHNGDAAIDGYLNSIGVAPGWGEMVDGSGLSHHDHIAPSALVAVLSHIAAEPDANAYIASLCRPGHGTLIHRLIGSPARRWVYAKDGHITGASTISGYMLLPHRSFVFSIMVNHYRGNVNYWQDDVITALYRWAVSPR